MRMLRMLLLKGNAALGIKQRLTRAFFECVLAPPQGLQTIKNNAIVAILLLDKQIRSVAFDAHFGDGHFDFAVF